MTIELSDPAWMDSLRLYLQRHGCLSEPTGLDTVEVRVLWSPDAQVSDAQLRAKVVGHLREWCADKPGIQANLLG